MERHFSEGRKGEKRKTENVGFEFLTALTMNSIVLWDGLLSNQVEVHGL
jgi:hypothetical protein